MIFPPNNVAVSVSTNNYTSPSTTYNLTDKWQFWLSIVLVIVMILACLGLKFHRYLKKKNKMRLRFEAKKDQVQNFENPPSYSQIFRHASSEMENNFFDFQLGTVITPRNYDMFFAYPLIQQQSNTTTQSEINVINPSCNSYEAEVEKTTPENTDSVLKTADFESITTDLVLKSMDSALKIEMEENIKIQET
ncbi:uncharacterized protein LOC105846389 isoform X2 [Hydra vulgaris]